MIETHSFRLIHWMLSSEKAQYSDALLRKNMNNFKLKLKNNLKGLILQLNIVLMYFFKGSEVRHNSVRKNLPFFNKRVSTSVLLWLMWSQRRRVEDVRMWFLSLDMAATASSWERNSTSASPVDLPFGATSM